MKCEKCGAEIPEGMSVCANCSGEKTNGENIKNIDGENINADAAAAENKNGADSEFDKQYSMAFEKRSEDNGYKIDEELKRKRELRYDETFSNMSDAEKIKALEAARLQRKERRERKAKKKEEGGMLAFLNKDKPEAEKPESNDGLGSGNQDKVKSGNAKAADRTFGAGFTQKLPKLSAEPEDKSEGESRRGQAVKRARRGFKMSPKTGLAAGCIIAVLVIGVVIAAVNMAGRTTAELPEQPTVYTKGNTMFSAYDGKIAEISAGFIKSEYKAPEATPAATAGRRGRDDDEEASAPEPYYEPVKEKELITYTADGAVIYYFDNADLNKNSGSLNYTVSGKKKGTVKIADEAYYNIAAAEDGSGVLYLTGTDKYGGGGTLNYWSAASKTSTELAEGILPGDYMFAQNGSILYLDEYNSEYNVGDLYCVTLSSGAISSITKADSDVYRMYGANPDGSALVYSKNYDDESGCFDLYMKRSGDPILITDGSRCEPMFLKNSDGMYAGGSYEEYYQSLYYVSLTDGRKEKLGSGLTELVKLSKDEQSVIYRKANAEGTAFDYFYAAMNGTEGQMLARNITVLDDEDHKRVSQFEITDDFTKAAFIQGYDKAVESGALYTVSITGGIVGSDKKISDTAYSCSITPDGQTVRYADNYDVNWNLVKLNAYTGEKNTVLAEDVGAGAFTFDRAGKYIVYAKNYSLENKTGDVYCVDNKGKNREVVKGVSSYGLKSDGNIVYYNSQSGETFELFLTREDGKGKKTLDDGVTRVIAY